MVRIIIDKSGVQVDAEILAALVAKCERNGLYVKSSGLEATRATIILSENISAVFVVDKLNAANKAVICQTCNTMYIRGVLPAPSLVPFRCCCGKWVSR